MLTFFIQTVSSQSLHLYTDKSTTLTGLTRLVDIYGPTAGGSNLFIAVDMAGKTTKLPRDMDVQVKLYMPKFDGSAPTATSFTAHHMNGYVFDPTSLLVMHSATKKIGWVTQTGTTYVDATFQFNLLPALTATTDLTTASASAVSVAFTPSGQFLSTFDIAGSSRMGLMSTGADAGNKNRLYLADVSGATPTIGAEIKLNTAGDLRILDIFQIFTVPTSDPNKYRWIYFGMANPSMFTAVQEIDVSTAGGSVAFKASWSSLDFSMFGAALDNLNNQDYIYTMLLETAYVTNSVLNCYVGVLQVSQFVSAQTLAGTGPQAGDIYSTGTTGVKVATGTEYFRLFNAGTSQYIIAVPGTSGNKLRMYAKLPFADFGKTFKDVFLPTGSPITSATYAYGIFRHGSTERFSLYYQQADLDAGDLFKVFMADCTTASQFFFNVTDNSCIVEPSTTATAMVGYRKDTAKWLVEPCTASNCISCAASAATCEACKTGYSLLNGACVLCNVANCTTCNLPNSCQTCISPWAGTACDKFQCSVTECTSCSGLNFCSVCANGKVPSADGSQCLVPESSCKPKIPQCTTCASNTRCNTCNQDYHLSDDFSACLPESCTIDHCTACDSNNLCLSCINGFTLASNKKSCNLTLYEIRDQTYSDFNVETQQAYIQLEKAAADYDLAVFLYVIIDEITKKTYVCSKCSASLVPEFYKAMKFFVVSEVELLSATLQCSYPLSSVKSSSRLLQETDGYGAFRIENIRLPGSDGTKSNDKIAYEAFTTINALRFFGTIFLGLFNSAHAFWSTYQYSWIQLWALLPGKFISYPDRFLNWHYKWYLLVIDFGDPFKSWKDWNSGGTKCFAQNEYPTSRLGCGFVDNFGQNFIIIFCVLAFCLLISSIMVIDWWRKRRTGSPSAQPGKRRFFRSNTQIEKQMPKILATIYIGLGMPYFFRFMDAIQPSIIYFSMLQFATYVVETTNLGVSVFFAVMFFLYYLATTAISFLLAMKLWDSIKESDEEIKDLGRTARKVGGWYRTFSFHYNGFTRVTRFWHLLYPVVEYVRVLLICIFMIALRKHPKTSLGLVFLVEIIRIAYIAILHKYRISFLYALQDYVITGFFLLYLILKIASNDSYSEEAIQVRIGWAMAFFLGVIWAFILIDTIIDTFINTKDIIQMLRDKKKAASDKSKSSNEINVLQMPHSDPRLINHESERMMQTQPVPAEGEGDQSPPPRFKPPVSSNRRGDYESDDMNEEYSVRESQNQNAYYNDVQVLDPQSLQIQVQPNDGYDGYLSKDINEKNKKTNRGESSRILQTEHENHHPSVTSPVTNNKIVVSSVVENQPHNFYDQPSKSNRDEGEAYNSRDMEEDY